ncbi:MAG: hypothetical protein JWM05_3123 [Acidimicrobiales bacterium]|nr:hypothetical protein [Acidimicrobiales bacterium]
MSYFSSPPLAPAPADSAAEPATVGHEMRWVMAAFSAVAAVVHFGYAPAHWSEYAFEGVFFLTLGWLQFVWAGVVVTRPSRPLLLAGAVGNVGVIALWVVTRTAGLPFGPHHGVAEKAAFPDLLSTGLEAGVVLLAAALLLRPALAERRVPSLRLAAGVTSFVAVAALAAGSVSITPKYVAAHSHTHTHVTTTGTGSTVAAGAHQHDANGNEIVAAPAGSSGTPTTIHNHTGPAGPYAAGTSPCEKAIGTADPEGGVTPTNATQGHNHHGALPQEEVSATDRKKLVAQQKLARAAAERYPTVADAEKAGYRKSTFYIACIGAHYTNIGLVGSFDPAKPSELLYDGTDPNSKMIGLSYLIVYPNGPPEGFAGPNDKWHQHSSNGGLCMNAEGVVIGGEAMSKSACEARGGRKNGLKDIWMVHDWVAPGWDSAWGVFSAENPELGADVRTP